MTTTTDSKTQSPTSSPSGEPELEVTPKAQSESFGTWLRRQRELREITLREIADTSKISLRYLQALEDDRFDLLPAPVFAKGFLRQYARYVGLDPEETVNFYLSADEQSQENAEELPTSRRRPSSVATWSYALAALMAAILLMVVVWMLLRLNRQSGPPPGAVDTATAMAAATPEVPAVEPHAGEVPGAPASGENPAPADAEIGATAPLGGIGGENTGTADPPAEAGDSAQEGPQTLFVTLDFRDNCWVRATVDGEVKADRVYTQGESLQLWGKEQVDLELGNALVVDLEIDGHVLKLDETSKNPVRRLSIDREMAAALLQSEP